MENDEQEVEVQEDDLETTSEEVEDSKEEEDTTDWKAEALKYKAILDRNKKKPPEVKKQSKSDGFDLGMKGYLKASGIKTEEFDFVKEQLAEAGHDDIDRLLENKYFQSSLEEKRSLDATAAAAPTGKRGSGPATDSVEYWLTKPIDEVPKEMRAKVVNARLEKEDNKGVFYNS